ncbi:MAG: winged helix-turn-helix transcriptional regulator [Erysipelotrichaceae bacterium]|nr:winged helix-turn-helix transcriptional regulator [Erysipelotrichaceae bacterium]
MINDLKTITILFRATNQIEKIIAEDVAQYGLNPSEFGALEVLYHKVPLPIQSICEKVLIASSSMSYVIENLIKKDFILKTKDIQDKRYHIVELTNKGRDLMNDIYPKHVQKLRKYIDILNQEDELSLQLNLKKLGKQEK